MNVLELKFLLKLLGFPGYRAPLSQIRLGPRLTAADRNQICQQLRDRDWVDCSEAIISLKTAPPGKALLKLKSSPLPITDAELAILQASAKTPISPAQTGLPVAQWQPLLQDLSQRGLIQLQTRIREVWVTESGQTFLKESYTPQGRAAISLELLNNYLRFLRQFHPTDGSHAVCSHPPTLPSADRPTDEQVLQMIQALDHELGTENYLPLFHLRQKLQPPLMRDEVDRMLYRLQRQDQIELSSLQEAIAYTPEQVNAGIPQDIGGPLFFISTNP